MKKIIFMSILVFIFSQCNHKYEYAQMINVNSSWNKKDTLNFNFTINNPEDKKNIYLVLRNNNNYPFNNIYLFVEMKQGGKTMIKDTVGFKLANNKGEWLGTGVGAVKEIYKEYKKDFKFSKKGEYQISITQGMRKDTLLGIEDLGINIE